MNIFIKSNKSWEEKKFSLVLTLLTFQTGKQNAFLKMIVDLCSRQKYNKKPQYSVQCVKISLANKK